MHECVVMIFLLFRKCVFVGDSFSVVDDKSLKRPCLVFPSLESLGLVTVVLVTYRKSFSGFDLPAESHPP